MLLVRDHPREYGENTIVMVRNWVGVGSSPRIRGKCRGLPVRCVVVRIIPANTGKIRTTDGTYRDHWDHPREYGENQLGRRALWLSTGSSPRIRGKSTVAQLSVKRPGIIPANTGKMRGLCWSRWGVWDHPREYGENTKKAVPLASDPGSSPRIRGKYHKVMVQMVNAGIIPANTGKIGFSAA